MHGGLKTMRHSKLADISSRIENKDASLPSQVSCPELRYNTDRKERVVAKAKLGIFATPALAATLGYIVYESGALLNNPIDGAVTLSFALTLGSCVAVAANETISAVKSYQEIISTPEKTVTMRDTLKLLYKDLFSGKIKE